MSPSGDGNGWVRCARGHRHWGRHGAAGLLVFDPTGDRVVLQHRALGTDQGGTWSLPGGARDSHEHPVSAALREATEEAGLAPGSVCPLGWSTADHGGWRYTTVLAQATAELDVRAVNWESERICWVPRVHVHRLPLHPGFAESWPALQVRPPALTIVVDARGSALDLADLRRRCEALASAGLTSDVVGHDLERLVPALVLVTDAPADDRPRPSWTTRAVDIVDTVGAIDGVGALDVSALRAARHDLVGTVLTVSADPTFVAKVSADAIRSPAWFERLLPEGFVAR